MVLFNYATRELTAKIVYYGPGLCGKTTNLEFVHNALPQKTRGKMLSLATQTDRTLFFDFLPIDLGSVKGMKTRVQLYTVPGQVFYDATRKLVLKGADGVVFVADSQDAMMESNIDSWENLNNNLAENGLDIRAIPLVIQYNKRDLPNVTSIKQLDRKINTVHAPYFEAIAITGKGVQETLRGITKIVLQNLSAKYSKDPGTVAEHAAAASPAASEPQEEPQGMAAMAGAAGSMDSEPVVAPPRAIDLSTPTPSFADVVEKVEEEVVKEMPGRAMENVAGDGEEEMPVTLEPLSDGMDELAMEDLEELQEVEEVTDSQEMQAIPEPITQTASHGQTLDIPVEQPVVIAADESEPTERKVEHTLELEPDEVAEVEAPAERFPVPEDQPEQFPRRAPLPVVNVEANASAGPGQSELAIPVEITVTREGQEIRLQLAINLKIKLVR